MSKNISTFAAENVSAMEEQEAAALAQAFAGSCAGDRERLAKIVDLLPCYVVLLDREGRILFYNKAFVQYFGAPGDNRCYAALRGQSEPCRFCPPLDAGRSGGTSVMEWVHPKNRHAFRVYSYPFTEADGRACIMKAGFNITASLRVQQALDLSEQSYRVITDNLSIGIALLDTHLRIKTGNIRLSKWFAQDFQLDKPICGLLKCGAEYERAAVEEGFTCPGCPFHASLSDGAGHEKELAVTFKDGSERVLRLVTCPVTTGKSRTKTPQIRALIMMVEDITNRLRVNRRLQHARKLEAMSTLAGGIAHEINQPLSALHLYASGLQMLMEKGEAVPEERTRERLALIMYEAEKIRSIISHMRTLVMQEGEVPLEPVSLAAAVNTVLDIMRMQLEMHHVVVDLRLPDALPLVLSNPVQMEQVLINLLGNAVHAMNNMEQSDRVRRILIKGETLEENGKVRLTIADSGPGLAGNGEQIFDPFYTTKERHEGMGLGLSIVHGLAAMWGAEIAVVPQHRELGGASFLLELTPADTAASGLHAEEGAVVAHDSGPDAVAPSPSSDAFNKKGN